MSNMWKEYPKEILEKRRQYKAEDKRTKEYKSRK